MKDVLVIGGGHNALTAGAYLAKAGFKVALFERRHVVGGAVCTEDDIFPGYKVDVGSGVHIMLHLTPTVRELELEKFGLQYLDMNPIAWQPTPGERVPGFGLYKELDKTIDSIAQVSAEDAIAYKKFVQSWDGFADKLFKAFQRPPTGLNLFASFAGTQAPDMNLIQGVIKSYGEYIRNNFKHPAVRSALTWLAAQSGPPPGEIGSGGFLMWHAVLHRHGAKRAVGGSGALSKALAACIEHHGGEVHLSAPIERIEIIGGAAKRLHLKDGRSFEGSAIVSGAHVQTTMLELLHKKDLPANLGTRVEKIRVGNGFGLIHRVATNRLPDYGHEDATNGMQLLCPSLEYLEKAFRDYDAGLPSQNPSVLGMSFTKIDPSLAPANKHLLYLWSQYYPFLREDKKTWNEETEQQEANKIEEVLYQYAPNMRGAIEQRFTQSPRDLQERIGLKFGNVMHIEMGLDQMFMFRPIPELSGYRTPIPNLYLCGASTHPGGGVFSASGRAVAKIVEHDLQGGTMGKIRKSIGL